MLIVKVKVHLQVLVGKEIASVSWNTPTGHDLGPLPETE